MDELTTAWPEFTFVRAADFQMEPELLPEDWGLYLFAFSEACGLPARARAIQGREETPCGDRTVVYVGQTVSWLRQRVKTQLFASSWTSTFRKTVGLVMQEPLALEISPGYGGIRNYNFGYEGEGRLTDWLAGEVVIGFRDSDSPLSEEKALIAERAPLLNITGRLRTPEGRRLAALRQSALPYRPRRPVHRARPSGRRS